MKNNLLAEIVNFKNDVKSNGMYINIYLNKRKEFINKIEYARDRELKFFRILYFYSLISREQYFEYRERINNARKYYKKILSFY